VIKASVKLDLKGLRYMRGSSFNKHIRIALNKAAVPAKAAVIQAAPEDRGNLKKSIKIKTVYYKKSKVWAAIVGPGKSFTRKIRPRRKKVKKPGNFAKLVNRLGLKAAKKVLGARRANKVSKAVFGTKKRKRKVRKLTGATRPVRPARYAHLTQWGGGHTKGLHWLERALRKSSKAFNRIMGAALAEAVRAAAK
jgi:hypothetical protein